MGLPDSKRERRTVIRPAASVSASVPVEPGQISTGTVPAGSEEHEGAPEASLPIERFGEVEMLRRSYLSPQKTPRTTWAIPSAATAGT